MNKLAELWPVTLLQKRFWHSCFPVNFENFLRAPFLQKTFPVAASVHFFFDIDNCLILLGLNVYIWVIKFAFICRFRTSKHTFLIVNFFYVPFSMFVLNSFNIGVYPFSVLSHNNGVHSFITLILIFTNTFKILVPISYTSEYY